MCLTISIFQRQKIAKEDIECYKYVDLYYGSYQTLFMTQNIIIGETYHSEIYGKLRSSLLFQIDIREGLHSCHTKYDLIQLYICATTPHTKIVKCIIPKGSKYYSSNKEYVSNTLKYIEIVND